LQYFFLAGFDIGLDLSQQHRLHYIFRVLFYFVHGQLNVSSELTRKIRKITKSTEVLLEVVLSDSDEDISDESSTLLHQIMGVKSR